MIKKNRNNNYWVTVLAVNLIIIYISASLYPKSVVLGNANIPKMLAAVVNSLILTLLLHLVIPITETLKLKTDEFSIGAIYLGVNIVSLWILARLAVYTGFGITSFFVAIILGLVLSIVQYTTSKLGFIKT